MDSISVSNPNGSLAVYMGTGSGLLALPVVYAGGALPSTAVVAADVNGDGKLDAITVNGHPSFGTTNGFIGVYLQNGSSFSPMIPYTTGTPVSVHLCAGDFDGDGVVDVATVSLSNQLSILLGQGNGTFGAPTLLPIQPTGGAQSSIGCRDLNGDNKTDVVVTSPSSARLCVFLTDGSPSLFSPLTALTNDKNGQTAGIAFGDANGDGNIDILSNGAAGAYVYSFQGNGAGTFATGTSSPTGAPAVANSALGLAAAKFDNDNNFDIYVLATTPTGGVLLMQGSGTGLFSAGNKTVTGASPASNAIASGDMDNDGHPDIVATNYGSNTLTVILNAL